ncbi:MAG: hypothetical protein L3J08_06795 [Flavobacteriaceae bacterium]|nr:hypothetical protein [Flavobacteriaceae bacterium]
MSISNYLRRFEYIHWLIKQQATGDCNEFAQKLGLCKRQLLNTLADLRAMGAPIAYSKSNNCYYYTHKWHPFTGLPPEDLNTVKGGGSYFKNIYRSAMTLHPTLLNLSNFC